MHTAALVKLEQKGWRDGHEDWPFRVNAAGVFKEVQKENKQSSEVKFEWVRICSRLEVVAETRDTQGKNWGRLLNVHTREDRVN